MLIGSFFGCLVIGMLSALPSYIIIQRIMDKKVYDTGITKKIIKQKPIFYNNFRLSLLLTIIFVAIIFAFLIGSIYLSEKIQLSIYGEDRSFFYPLEEIFNYFYEKFK